MKNLVKNILAGSYLHKIMVVTLCVAGILVSWSCQNQNEGDQILSDEQISHNLSIKICL